MFSQWGSQLNWKDHSSTEGSQLSVILIRRPRLRFVLSFKLIGWVSVIFNLSFYEKKQLLRLFITRVDFIFPTILITLWIWFNFCLYKNFCLLRTGVTLIKKFSRMFRLKGGFQWVNLDLAFYILFVFLLPFLQLF